MRTSQIAKFLLLAALANAIGCAGDPTAPSASSPIGTGQNATVGVESPVAQREFTGGDADLYYVSFSLKELSGNAGANIKAIDLTFGNGVTATFGPERATAAHVGAGKTVSVADLSAAGSVTSRATSVQIRVLLTDDRGKDMVSLAATGVTSTYVLSGRITNKTTGRPVSGARVAVTFGGASGRSATSDGNGAFVLGRIPAGPVSFAITAAGFPTVTRTATMDGNVTVDVALE
jgi:hypothetical protein